jgi:predicted dehydrogenase
MEREMKPTRYTASVVGGGSGGKLSLAGLAASSRYDLVAAADLRADVRAELAERYPGIRLYATHEEMFAASPTDVICVSTWPPSHREIVLDALRLEPQGILCEKPLGDTAAAGAAILAAIKPAGLPVVTPHGLLQNRHAQEIMARVHGGEIGELDLVEIECSRWDIINAGIHWLNYFVNLVPDDPMDWVMAIAEASTRTYRDGMEVETNAITYVQTKKGVRAVMHTGDDVLIRRPGKGILFRLVGTKGLIEFYAWESAYRILNAARPEGQLYEVPRYPQSAHQRYLESLAEQIDTGKRDYAIPESSLVALELCEGAYLSSAHRCKVTLPLAEFTAPPEPDWHPGKPYRGQGGRDGRKL